MDLKQLDYFVHVAELGSFSRAAEQLHLAPSSISAQLRELSGELGIPLFESAGRNIVLSTAGQALLPHFRTFLQQAETIVHHAHHLHHEPVGELRLFAPSSMCIYRLPPVIEAMQQQAPQLEITLTHEPFDYQNALRQRQIDAAILVSQHPEQHWQLEPLRAEPVIFVCHPQRHQRGELTLPQLQQHPLITTEPGCSYRIAAEQHFQSRGLHLNPRQSFANVEVIRRCLLANMGMALLPACVVQEDITRGTLCHQAVEGTPYPFRSLLAYPKGQIPSSRLECLLQVIRAQSQQPAGTAAFPTPRHTGP